MLQDFFNLSSFLDMAGANEVWFNQAPFSRRKKLYCSDVTGLFIWEALGSSQFSHWTVHRTDVHKKVLNPIQTGPFFGLLTFVWGGGGFWLWLKEY